jgi:hypothetical protein
MDTSMVAILIYAASFPSSHAKQQPLPPLYPPNHALPFSFVSARPKQQQQQLLSSPSSTMDTSSSSL